MEYFKICNQVPIQISDSLKGDQVVVLLHGYLETLAIWESFIPLLQTKVRVISLDLPGNGMSSKLLTEQSMEKMADTLAEVLDHCGVQSATILGHSMGGYIALAFANKYQDRVDKLCLLSSVPMADTAQKMIDRDREITLIKGGKLELILLNNIKRMFAKFNVARLDEQIEEIIECALISDEDGIIACIEGMKNRPDLSDFLAKWTKPLMLIYGQHDEYIPVEIANDLINSLPNCKNIILEQSGHSGFIEEPELVATNLLQFILEV